MNLHSACFDDMNQTQEREQLIEEQSQSVSVQRGLRLPESESLFPVQCVREPFMLLVNTAPTRLAAPLKITPRIN